MKAFVKQAESTPETVAKNVCYTVSLGINGSAGIAIKEDVSAFGVESGYAVSGKSCSEWKEVPGGYTVYL